MLLYLSMLSDDYLSPIKNIAIIAKVGARFGISVVFVKICDLILNEWPRLWLVTVMIIISIMRVLHPRVGFGFLHKFLHCPSPLTSSPQSCSNPTLTVYSLIDGLAIYFRSSPGSLPLPLRHLLGQNFWRPNLWQYFHITSPSQSLGDRGDCIKWSL